MARENAHFQQHVWGYFPFKRLLRCSDDRTLPLVQKICWFDGFLGRKPPSSELSSDRRLFFCAAFTSWYKGSYRSHTITTTTKRLNQWIHSKKHRNTSKVIIFHRKSQRSPVTRHNSPVNKVYLHSPLVTCAWDSCENTSKHQVTFLPSLFYWGSYPCVWVCLSICTFIFHLHKKHVGIKYVCRILPLYSYVYAGLYM